MQEMFGKFSMRGAAVQNDSIIYDRKYKYSEDLLRFFIYI